VFYDFVNGLDPSLRAVRLVVSLYNNTAQYGQPSVLPTVYADGSSTHVGGMFISALVSAKQPVPRYDGFVGIECWFNLACLLADHHTDTSHHN